MTPLGPSAGLFAGQMLALALVQPLGLGASVLGLGGDQGSPVSLGTWLVLAAAWAICYLVACWVYPYAACPRCKGKGKRHSPSGKTFGDCRRCKGKGRRVRVGRRIWNAGINR